MNHRQNVRNLAFAFGTGAMAALIFEALLQNALAALRSPGGVPGTPWWMIGRVFERSIWVLAALVAWVAATPLSRALADLWPATHTIERTAALSVAGRVMIGVPILLVLASLIALMTRITMEGNWGNEGRMFLTGSYYSNVLLAYVPWAAGGVTLLTIRRHVADR
jgi:hypothetical protein